MWTPPSVSDQLLRERHEFEKELRDRVVRAELVRVKGILDEFNYELRQIDPLLELVRAPADCGNTGMIPHYYHVVRWNEGAPPSFIAIHEDGRFVEPDSRLFEMLAKGDLWDDRNVRRMKDRHRRAEEFAAKHKAQQTEERRQELFERVNAATRTQVSMNRDVPWAQNAAGFNRIKGQKKQG